MAAWGVAVRRSPDTRPADRGFVAGLSAALVAYSGTIQLVPSYQALYVPLNLLLALLLLLVASRVGLGRDELGLRPDRAPAGVTLGVVVAAVPVAGLAIAVAVPALHPLLEDERVGDIGIGLLAYRALIRVPLGTVLLEEVACRGVLLGAWRRLAGTRRAVVGSSAVFGLWHIRPTWELLEVNGATGSGVTAGLLIARAVVLTAAGGAFFCWLRIRIDSLLAPIVLHALVNASAMVAAFTVLNWA